MPIIICISIAIGRSYCLRIIGSGLARRIIRRSSRRGRIIGRGKDKRSWKLMVIGGSIIKIKIKRFSMSFRWGKSKRWVKIAIGIRSNPR